MSGNMKTYKLAAQKIEELLLKIEGQKENFELMMVCNVKEKTNNYHDYSDNSIETEFLSQLEFNELLESVQQFGFYSTTYFDVNDFFFEVIKHQKDDNNLTSLVFETTQRGTGRGKDSLIPAFCELNDIYFTGPNAYINSLCSNKYHWTKILEAHGVPVPRSWQFTLKDNWLQDIPPAIESNLIIKPAYECASIGISVDSIGKFDSEFLLKLKEKAECFKQPLIVQEFISGYEVEVPFIVSKHEITILPPIGLKQNETVVFEKTFLTYEEVQNDNYDFFDFNSLFPKLAQKIVNHTLKIIKILELEGYMRIDFRVNEDGSIFVFDINSYPHIVNHSSFAKSFKLLGFDTSLLLPVIISNSIKSKN